MSELPSQNLHAVSDKSAPCHPARSISELPGPPKRDLTIERVYIPRIRSITFRDTVC